MTDVIFTSLLNANVCTTVRGVIFILAQIPRDPQIPHNFLRDCVVLIILEQCVLGKNYVKLNSKNILFTLFFATFYLPFKMILAHPTM